MENKFQLYEDQIVKVFLVEKPIIEGHVRLYIKKDVKFIDQLEEKEINHIFKISSLLSTLVFENLSAHGTNIIVNSGINNLFIDILPRYNEDKLKINWEPKQTTPEKLDASFNKIKGHTQYLGIKKETSSDNNNSKEVVEKDIDENNETEELDYRIRQINRIP